MQTAYEAFLLTRHWRDGPQGIELQFWAHSSAGPLRLVFPDQKAVCFIPRENGLPLDGFPLERKALNLTDLQGQPVDGLYFRQQRQLQQFRERTAGSSTLLLESDIKIADRFLMERFVTAPMQVSGKAVQRDGYLEWINPRIRPADYQPQLSYLSLDIETDGSANQVLSIAYCGPDVAEILMQGEAADWPSDLPIQWVSDETALLRLFLQRLAQLDPDLILGWNLINFDLDYLERRCRAHRIPFALGRGGELAAILQPQQSGQARVASIPGRVALDGIDNLRAAFWSFESFSLNHVAGELLGRKKLISDGQDKLAEIRRQFREDRPALAAYNLEDCRLVEAIFAKTDLINFIRQRATMTGLSLGRLGGSVAAFDNLYLPLLHRAGVVAHDIGAFRHSQGSPGGYVMDSQPGLYQNVLVLDFKSLYPSIIRTFHIDPLGMAFPGDDPIPGFLEASFSRERHILPSIITELWAKRDLAKQRHDKSLSQAIKIIMNSFYGVLGSSGCRFYDPRLASSITRRGHEIITRSRDWLESAGHPVIYGDTDSLFVLLGEGCDEARARETGQQLARDLNRWWNQTITEEFRVDSALEIEFETHFIQFIMPTIRGTETGSKKRYAGVIRNAQGDNELVFKGLESVRSDWTPLAQQFQRELYRRIFFNEPYETYISDLVNRLKRGELDRELVYRKRLRRKLDDYQRNVPPHVQAARKLDKPRRTISYLITLNGPEPVERQTSPIDYQHYIERQIGPVADGILHFLNDSFERITADQMTLF
ncbi:DNA polymerase II [Sedimenticola sp.]|uniref:DNA polymerase II n=1 Tax=Sedimenticola sp. TaxID=1940285 RepID=UPI003D133A43